MQLDPYVQLVAEQLRTTAALGDDRTREIAAGLADATNSAVRLALLRALSAAAAEITAELIGDQAACAGHTISVQLDDHEAHFAVTNLAAPQQGVPVDEGEANARISLRLPDALKNRIDEAAAGEGISVNAWLIRAANTALVSGTATHTVRNTHRMTGWVSG